MRYVWLEDVAAWPLFTWNSWGCVVGKTLFAHPSSAHETSFVGAEGLCGHVGIQAQVGHRCESGRSLTFFGLRTETKQGRALPGQVELFANVFVRAPVEKLMVTPADRFRYVLNALVRDVELPVERDDLLSPPEENDNVGSFISLAGRKAVYNFIVHGVGPVEKALQLWIGRPVVEQLRVQLMKTKIAAAGMDVSDFSKGCQAMVPLANDRWRGDVQTQTSLMREIAVYRAEKQRKRQELAEMSEAERKEREQRSRMLRAQLSEVDMVLEDLPWSGLEPNRLTFNRLVEFGDEQPDLVYDGKGPKSSMERWESGIRRLKVARAVEAQDEDLKQIMLDERMYNRIVLYVELGLHNDADKLVEELLAMRAMHETQWSRKKKRSKRWAFNFPLSDDEEEADGTGGEAKAKKADE